MITVKFLKNRLHTLIRHNPFLLCINGKNIIRNSFPIFYFQQHTNVCGKPSLLHLVNRHEQ